VNPLNQLGFLRVAVVATAGFSMVLPPNTSGQDQTAQIERVIVTGSAIPTAEEVGSNPVFSINRDLINKSAAGTAEQLLQRLPVMNGATIPVQNNATGGAGPAGTAALALRGLDPGATLVLIDHRRVAPFPGSANSAYGFVDLTPAADYVFHHSRPRSAFSIFPGFNFNLYSGSYPEQERWGGYTAFEHKICDDQVRIFGDFYYVDAKTHDVLAPTATGDFETPGKQPLFVPPNHSFPGGVPPFGGPPPAEVGMSPTAFNPFNPFEQIISGGTRARIFDFGDRLVDNENIAERFTVGVKGDKLFNGTWGYDGAFMYSQIEQISRFQGENILRFERILNAADPLFDPTSSEFIGQTIPFNPMVDSQHVTFPTNLPLIDFARLHTKDLFTSKLATLDLNIYTTDLARGRRWPRLWRCV